MVLQRLQCNDCGHRFSYFQIQFLIKLILAGTWIEFIYLMLQNSSLTETTEILKQILDYQVPTKQTVLTWRLKNIKCSRNRTTYSIWYYRDWRDLISYVENQKGSRRTY